MNRRESLAVMGTGIAAAVPTAPFALTSESVDTNRGETNTFERSETVAKETDDLEQVALKTLREIAEMSEGSGAFSSQAATNQIRLDAAKAILRYTTRIGVVYAGLNEDSSSSGLGAEPVSPEQKAECIERARAMQRELRAAGIKTFLFTEPGNKVDLIEPNF